MGSILQIKKKKFLKKVFCFIILFNKYWLPFKKSKKLKSHMDKNSKNISFLLKMKFYNEYKVLKIKKYVHYP